jgi:phage tail-like protein
LRGARSHISDVAATSTPVVHAVRAVGPRLSYLTYLPAVFGRRDANDPAGALFLERYLALFENRLTRVEGRYELIARMLAPEAADDQWLDFVAGWFDLVLDSSWPRPRRAALLAHIFELYKIRGTVEGILRFVELYTGHRPALVEGFQQRPAAGFVLGQAGTLGCAPLGGLSLEATAETAMLDAYAHRMTLVAYLDLDCDRDAAESNLRALVAAIVPAHVDVTIRLAVPSGRIGFESTIGLDFVLGEERRRPLLLGATGGDGKPTPVLGVDSRLPFGGFKAAEITDVGIQL